MRPVLVLAVLFAPTAALAGAWTLERGETNAFITSEFSYGDHGFDRNGNLVSVPDYQKFTLRGTVEYGVRDWLTGIGKAELKEETRYSTITTDSVLFNPPAPVTVREQVTFGAVSGGARVRLYKAPRWVFSAQAMVASGGFQSTGIADDTDSPSVEGRVLFGIGDTVMDRPVFADVQAAYVAYTDAAVDDEVKVDVTLGAQMLPNWLILAQSFTTYETGGDSHHTKLEGSVVRTINERLRVQLGGGGTVYGKNAVQEWGGKLSFWWRF